MFSIDNTRKDFPILNREVYGKPLVYLDSATSSQKPKQVIESIKKFEENDSRIKIVNVKNNEAFWGNRKYALTLGIKSAKHEQLLFMDADCIPSSKKWIKAHLGAIQADDIYFDTNMIQP